ncbi:MAG: hypothetical protein H6729_15195 [Deltaproteobacteria bacterium]|nr:hypothetical protein [Deltaproteobacteria bacterium]
MQNPSRTPVSLLFLLAGCHWQCSGTIASPDSSGPADSQQGAGSNTNQDASAQDANQAGAATVPSVTGPNDPEPEGPPPTGYALNVPMTVKEVAGVGATHFPVAVVVPLERGAYQDTSGLYVANSEGHPVPAQFEVLNHNFMTDNSIRHLLVHFQPDVGAFKGSGGTSKYYLRDKGTNPAPLAPVQVTDEASAITLDSGVVKIRVEKNPFRIVTPSGPLEATLNDQQDRPVRSFDAPNITVTLEERGPMRAVLRAEAPADMVNDEIRHGWAMRIYVYAGKPYVKVDYQLQNSVKSVVYSRPLYFESLTLSLETNQAATPQSVRANLAPLDSLPNTFDPLAQDLSPVSAGSVQVMIRHFWEMWPNGIDVDAEGKVDVELFPAWSARVFENQVSSTGLYWLHDMQHVVKEVLFNFGTMTPKVLNDLAKTFQFHPVVVLPVAWYAKTHTTLDMGGAFPATERLKVADLRKPDYPSYVEYRGPAERLGFANFGIDIQRKGDPRTAGGVPYSNSRYFLSENPADYYRAEDIAMGELNVMPEWMAQYDYEQDYELLGLTENPYAGSTWRKFAGNYDLPIGYISGTAVDSRPRDDQHAWFYHVEEAYWMTGNPWIRDWYRFVGQYRRARVHQKDPFPDMSGRAIAHALSHALQASRVTDDKELYALVGTYLHDYIGPYIARPSEGLLPTNVFQLGYLTHAMLSYLGDLPEPDAEVVNMIGRCVDWNVEQGNFAYTLDGSWRSDGSGFVFGDAQAWYGKNYGSTAALDHLMLYQRSGIAGGDRPYVDLTQWSGDYAGRLSAPILKPLSGG